MWLWCTPCLIHSHIWCWHLMGVLLSFLNIDHMHILLTLFFTLNIGSIFHMENMVLLDWGTLQPIVLFDGVSPRIVDACLLPTYVIASCQSSVGFLMMDAIKGQNVVFRHKLHFLDDFSYSPKSFSQLRRNDANRKGIGWGRIWRFSER